MKNKTSIPTKRYWERKLKTAIEKLNIARICHDRDMIDYATKEVETYNRLLRGLGK